MKNIFKGIIALMITFNGYSQNSNFLQNKGLEWQTLSNVEGLLINYKVDDCHLREDGFHMEEVYLQFVNPSLNVLKISWEIELKYGTKCFNCNGDNEELKFSITLKPLETIEGSCGDANEHQMRILSKFLNGESNSQLSDFNVKNIKVSLL